MKTKNFILPAALFSLFLTACNQGGSTSAPSTKTTTEVTTQETTTTTVTSSTTSTTTTTPSTTSTTTVTPTTTTTTSVEPKPGDDYFIAQGGCNYSKDKITIINPMTLVVKENDEFEVGTISTTMTQNGAADDGIVFNLYRPDIKKIFWEDKDVSYNFAFINFSGFLIVGKAHYGQWKSFGGCEVPNWSQSKSYKLTVSLDNDNPLYQRIRVFLDDQFMFEAADTDYVKGHGYGVRANNSNCTFTYLEKTNTPLKNNKNRVGDYILGNGSFNYTDNIYTANNDNSIIYSDKSLEYGQIETILTQSGVSSDSGIIFGLSRKGQTNFWETNVSYYFFFLSIGGNPYLGQVINGRWNILGISDPIPGYSSAQGTKNTLKVIREEGSIKCYIDGTLYINYIDTNPLLGTGFGFRAGKANVKFNNVTVTNQGSYKYYDNVDIKSGDVKTMKNGEIISTKATSVGLIKDSEFTSGELSADVRTYSQTTLEERVGIVFGSNEDASSYYVFYIAYNIWQKEQWGWYQAYLQKYENGKYTNVSSSNTGGKYITAGYNNGVNNHIRILIQNNTVYCYINTVLFEAYSLPAALAGSRYGFLSDSTGASISNYKVNGASQFKTCDTLIIGHSYMELWENYYKQDLADLSNDIANIGIGGTVAQDWLYLINSVKVHNPNKIIFMIGVNDINRSVTPSTIQNYISQICSAIHTALPSTKICLVSTNRCPQAEPNKAKIAQFNALLKTYVNDNSSYLLYGDLDNAFLDGSGNVIGSYFPDSLHPNHDGYLIIAQAIKTAFGV